MPAAITYLDEQRRLTDPRTPEGLYRSIMSKTGSIELAERALIEARVQEKTAAIGSVNLEGVIA